MRFVKISALAMFLTLPIHPQERYRMEDLPGVVQKTVLEHSGGQRIANIVREERNGQTVWDVEFDREGRNPRIEVGNDGTLLAEKEPGPLDK